jgi:6-phosphofructokinase 2
MIYTITLNPALDHFLDVQNLSMDDANRVTSECLYAGGKGIDVSRAIRRLGSDSMALGFIVGHNGQIMLELLKKEGVTCYFTPISQETRRNIIIGTLTRGTQTMLNARGPTVSKKEWKAFLTHLRLLDLRDSYVVLSGSLPRGVPIDAYQQVIALVQNQGAKAVLDTDGPALKSGLMAKPFAMKPNVNELRRLTGQALKSERAILTAATQLHRTGIKIVLVSMGYRGLLMVSDVCCCRAIPPAVRVRSTVGAGGSAVAGFVYTHAGGKLLEDCLRFAAAAGTAATLAPGNQLCRLREVERLAPRVQLEYIRPY